MFNSKNKAQCLPPLLVTLITQFALAYGPILKTGFIELKQSFAVTLTG